jgi:hypothetical protein
MIAEVNDQTQRLLQRETHDQLQRLHALALHSPWPTIQRYLDRKDPHDDGNASASSLQDPTADPYAPYADGATASATSTLDAHAWRQRLAHSRALWSRAIAPRLHRLRDLARDRLGLTPPALPSLLALSDALLTPPAGGGAPLSYRRPFESAPVELDEFFIGREAELAHALSAFDRFQRKLPSAVLIYGEQGCGMTSFAERLLRRAGDALPISRLSLSYTLYTEEPLRLALCELLGEPPALSFEHLRARLRGRRRPQVILIEGLHKLYLRTLRGVDALQQFLLLVSETSHALLWVVTANADALQSLRQLVRVDDSFTHHVALPRLDAQQLRLVIESRHRVTGYQLRYRSPHAHRDPDLPDGLWGLRARRKALAQSARADAFFSALARHSGGNIRLALFYWLRALAPASDSRQGLRVSPLQPLDRAFLSDLDLDQRLALALLIQHGGLTLRELAAAARAPLDAARALLNGMLHRHLLTVERGQADVFHVNPTLFALIADHLRDLHIL